MSKLKPQLIIADSGRRKRRGGGGFWSFLAFLIVFAIGVYVGTKLDEYDITRSGDTQQSAVSKDSTPKNANNVDDKKSNADFSQETLSSKEPAVVISEKIVTGESVTDDVSDPEEPTGGEGYDKESGLVSFDPVDITSPNRVETNEKSGEEDVSVDSAETDAFDAGNETEKTGGYRYTLQIAAFATPQEAEKIVNEYKAKGYDAYMVTITNSRGEEWNLVKIGRFRTIERAWDESALFEQREGQEAYVETMSQATKVNESWNNSEEADQ